MLGRFLRILGAPTFNPVAPYRYLLPNLYLSVADIANPDLFACGSRTWISLDIARFLRNNVSVGCVVWSLFCSSDLVTHPLQGGFSESEVISCSHPFQYVLTRLVPQFVFFKLKLARWGIGLIVKSICKLMRIGTWSEPRFSFVCQLVEVIGEADANETSGKNGLVLLGSLVGESQLRIPKLEPDIIFSNGVSLICRALVPH